jgi:cytochrome c55X
MNDMLFIARLFIASLLSTGLLFAQTAIAETATTIISSARQNELLYFIKHDCGSCHGMTLKGGLGPALLPETLAAKPKDYLVATILEGRQNTAMPPWKTMLSQDDAIWITEQLQNGSVQPTQLANSKPSQDKQAQNKQTGSRK